MGRHERSGGVAIAIARGSRARTLPILTLIAATATALIAIVDMADIANRDSDDESLGLTVEIGSGLVLTLVAALVTGAGAIWALARPRRAP